MFKCWKYKKMKFVLTGCLLFGGHCGMMHCGSDKCFVDNTSVCHYQDGLPIGAGICQKQTKISLNCLKVTGKVKKC